MAQIEQWDPNIRAPKQSSGGAYRNPQAPQQADWIQVNKTIQDSIKFMGDQIAQYAKQEAAFLKVWDDKGVEFEKGMGHIQNGGNTALENVTDEIVAQVAKESDKATRLRDKKKSREDKGRVFRREGRLEKAEGKQYHELTRKDKIKANKKLDQVQLLKNSIEKVASDLAKGEVENISWHNFQKNKVVKSFFNYLLTGEALPDQDLFSIDVSGDAPKIVWSVEEETVLTSNEDVAAYNEKVDAKIEALDKNADDYEEKKQKLEDLIYKIPNTDDWEEYTVINKNTNELTLQQLMSGADIFEDATADKTAITDLLNTAATEAIKRRDAHHKGPDGASGGVAWDEEKWYQEQKSLIKSTDKSNYEFIFNNMTHTINANNRMTDYDPNNAQHVADVEQWIDNYLGNKIGEAPPVRVPAATLEGAKLEAKGYKKVGGQYYQGAIVNKAENVVNDLVIGLTDQPKGQIYNASNLMPALDEEFEVIRDGNLPTSERLDNAMETYIAQDYTRPRATLNFKNQLNKLIEKFNENGGSTEGFTENQKNVISAYKSHLGAFDKTVDLDPYFDPSLGIQNPVYDRVTKTINFTNKDNEPDAFDLTIESQFDLFAENVMATTGLNRAQASYVLRTIFEQHDKHTPFKIYKPKLN